jgi:hypothetical protein
MLASPVLALALIPLFANWTSASRATQTDTADFARDLLNSVEPYGVLVTVGDNDTFPLWYAQEVEGVRKDVVVANTSLLNTDWYVRQLIRRPVYEYDAAKGPAIYRGKAWPKPATGPLKMSLADADKVPLVADIQETAVFNVGRIHAVLSPRQIARRTPLLSEQNVGRLRVGAWHAALPSDTGSGSQADARHHCRHVGYDGDSR